MSNQPSEVNDMRELVIQFQKDTLEEWSRPGGKNHDMIKLAYKFTDTIQALIASKVLEAEKERVEKNKSFCGCPMCEYHTSAFALQAQKERTE